MIDLRVILAIGIVVLLGGVVFPGSVDHQTPEKEYVSPGLDPDNEILPQGEDNENDPADAQFGPADNGEDQLEAEILPQGEDNENDPADAQFGPADNDEDQLEAYNTFSTKQTKTLRMGADNPVKAGHAMGYVQKSGLNYYSYANYYAYPYLTTSYERHGFAIFDLQDLGRWGGMEVTEAKLVIRNFYMSSNVGTVGLTDISTIPYEGASTTTISAAFSESGSTGTQIGTYTKPSSTPGYVDLEVTLNSAGVTAINNSFAGGSPYAFGVGMYIKSKTTSSSGYCRWNDIRLDVTFNYTTDMQPTSSTTGGIAFGDDLSGHIYNYTSPTNRPYGYSYTRLYSTSSYRGYAHWEIDRIKSIFPQDKISKIEITKVSVRFNQYVGVATGMYVNHMQYNVTSSEKLTNLWSDCADGDNYYGPSSYSSANDVEYEWNLGANGVKHFQDAFDNKSFFDLGFLSKSSSGYFYPYGPKLVIEWTLRPNSPPVADSGGPYYGTTGSPVLFDASGSADADNDTLEYRWDFENDGNWDTNYSSSPQASYTWNSVHNGTVKVEVFDGEDTDTDTNVVIITEAQQGSNQTTIDIDPNTLNPKSNGKWITCYIEVPSGYNVEDIDISSILLNGNISAESRPTGIGDHDNDSIPDLMVKFDRQAVIDLLEPGDSVEIIVTFEVNGTDLSGTDHIRVLDKEKKDKKDKKEK